MFAIQMFFFLKKKVLELYVVVDRAFSQPLCRVEESCFGLDSFLAHQGH